MKILATIFLMGVGIVAAPHALAQPATTLQLPTTSSFRVPTVVRVPDGGSLFLGGVTRSASGSRSSGLPFSGVPFYGRPFRNRAIGGSTSASGARVSVHVLVMRELEADVLAEAERRHRARAIHDPNGSEDVQARARFLSRHIGHRTR